MSKKDPKTRKVTFNDNHECLFMQTLPIINGKTIDVDDMADVKDINEVDLLYNLLNRLKIKKTFTNVGPTLLIVNPFTRIEGVYGEEQIEYYLAKHEKENPDIRQKITEPHLYDLVLIAIRELLKNNSKNQALVISGESGAGKTEATKNAMKCITYFFGKNTQKSSIENDIPLETKILNCNPILEAFGNAKTVRNDNSSRFGKYVKIKLNSVTNVIEGAEMDTYLLEKSRISELNEKERNYHVFYFLLKCGDDHLLSSLYLNSDIKSYKYLYTGEHQVMEVPTIDDKACFIELTDCFKSTGFSDDDITSIFKIVAAVLLLGNVRMKIANDKCIIENIDIFQNVCSLLGVDSDVLQTVLSRKPPMPGRTEYGGVYTQPQVKSYIDALAKELYNKLFLWIVTKLNTKLDKSGEDSSTKYIGLLDIFGFECFDKNSLEQICINYTNEQLQQLYIKDIFENDKAEFRREGLESKLHLLEATYKDNKDIIRLIKIFFNRIRDAKEDKNIYDIVVGFQKDIDKPPKNDKTFSKVKENKFITNKFQKESFSIEHTAKVVLYQILNMVEKNKDETKPGVVDCILASKNYTVQMIFTNTTSKEACEQQKIAIVQERTSVDNNKIKNRFLGMKFCGEMKKLKTELKLCDHHYVRCLKPNEEKKALLFHPNFVFNQIQYLGILATIQVRKSGFPMRNYYKDFYENYKLVLSSQIKPDENTNFVDITKKIIGELIGEDGLKKSEDECLYGSSKIYMKQGFSASLENAKLQKLKIKIESVKKIQVSVDFLKKKLKISKIRQEIEKLQKFFQSNKSKIQLQKKKEKIKVIQSAYLTQKESENFQKTIKNHEIIQNSLRMLISQSLIEKRSNQMKFLSFQLQLYMMKLKQIHRIKMRKVAINLLQKAKDTIYYNEFNNLWTKVNPYFLSLLARKKNHKIATEAKVQAKQSVLSNAINLFQLKLFLYKFEQKRAQTKKILSFSSSIMFSNYYIQMRRKVLIIQKYAQRLIYQQNAFKKICQNYFTENEKNVEQQNINILKVIFPNWIGHPTRTKIAELQPNLTSRNNASLLEPTQSYISRETYDKNLNDTTNYYIGKTEIDIIKERKQYTNSGYVNSISGKKPRIIKQKMKKPLYKDCTYPKYDPYSEPQIIIFAKIMDIDVISDDSENSDKPWCEQFMKIYRDAMDNDAPIQIINIGNCHSMAINSKGKVYSWGWNNYGQCGIDPSLSEIGYLLPSFIKDKKDKVPFLPILNYLQSGNTINVSGIKKVAIGDDYSFLLHENGTVISLGNNYLGQLGFGNCYMNKSGSSITQFKNNVSEIVTTGNSNIILTKQNELFLWHFSKDENLIQPTKLYTDKKIEVDSISSGKNFSIILTKSGVCYGLGSNERGELALDTKDYRMVPEEITSLMKFNIRIIQVRCGFKHVVCVAQNGTAYGWGNNANGQLGQYNKEIKGVVQMNIVNSTNVKERIIQVAAGFRTSFFMTEKRDIYYCGVLSEGNKNWKLTKFNIKEKSIEVGNETEFAPVRILTTFNRNMSIFYVSMADVRSLSHKFNNRQKVNEVLNSLAEKWTNNSSKFIFYLITILVEGPFIPHISRFFSSQFMKVVKKTKSKGF